MSLSGLAPIDAAAAGDLSFIAHAHYDQWLNKSTASAVLVRQDSPSGNVPCLIRVADPYVAFVRVAREVFHLDRRSPTGIDPRAVIAVGAELGENVSLGAYAIVEAGVRIGAGSFIGPHVYVGSGTQLGAGCQIGPNVTIYPRCLLGNGVIVQAGSVIGSDGFGYVRDGGAYLKIPHLGTVVLEDGVEIGANCTIDRGTFGETRICAGTKLDNLVHVAHNVTIGKNTVIAAQTGISGSTKLGNDVVVAGQVGFVGHIEIGDRAQFGAQAGVTKSIPADTTVSGYPAKPHQQARREEAALRRAPEMLKRLRKIEKWLLANAPEFADETSGQKQP